MMTMRRCPRCAGSGWGQGQAPVMGRVVDLAACPECKGRGEYPVDCETYGAVGDTALEALANLVTGCARDKVEPMLDTLTARTEVDRLSKATAHVLRVQVVRS